MNRCPKCNNSTVVKVTTQNKHKNTRGNMGILLWIIFFPFMLIWWFIRHFILGGRDHEFHKETYWRCNYCAHQFTDAQPITNPQQITLGHAADVPNLEPQSTISQQPPQS